jgi:hypothetical protein
LTHGFLAKDSTTLRIPSTTLAILSKIDVIGSIRRRVVVTVAEGRSVGDHDGWVLLLPE